jgi:hypothetical protein
MAVARLWLRLCRAALHFLLNGAEGVFQFANESLGRTQAPLLIQEGWRAERRGGYLRCGFLWIIGNRNEEDS